MARQSTPLTDSKIRTYKPQDKICILSDGGGLQLKIKPNGSKLWNFNYYHPITQKRVNMGLGSYPDISLRAARETAQQARTLVKSGVDPKEAREQKKAEHVAIVEHTLFNVAQSWFDMKKASITHDYANDIWRSFELHIFPSLKSQPISQISAPEVIAILRNIESKGALETVRRLTQRVNEIMRYAVNHGLIHSNPLEGIKDVFKKPKKQNMAALSPDQLPELMQKLPYVNLKLTTRCLLEWQLHTMTRPKESASAKWSEIDFDNAVWIIPAERMKKRREHRVPLTPQALQILERMKPISGNREHIFPADRDPKKPIHEQTANAALKRMNLTGRTTAHGFRSLASTTLNEQGFEPDLIEAALAHVDDNEVRRAYNRTDFLERRRPMMQWWSEHIQAAAIGTATISGRKALKVV
ncbi:integrase domain-containing protein [Vibrio mytili]|uniref:Integrase n=1 Tax=Vibrio mytili TaxID=50718 RepID=A0A0C3E9F1_9VIBR|nr:integrase domain-containing protein [Vibrio mytili]KIN11018.1 integrase [Vibrio mytili]